MYDNPICNYKAANEITNLDSDAEVVLQNAMPPHTIATVELVLPEPGEESKRLDPAIEGTCDRADTGWLPAVNGLVEAGSSAQSL